MRVIMGAIAILLVAGCAEQLRFAPSEPIKQNAELTHQIAVKVDNEGTEAQSPATKKLVSGTQASLSYIGRPLVAPDYADFETVNTQAQIDAQERPDVGKTVDSALELGIGVCALLGGVAGLKGVQVLNMARTKAKAFQEIIKNNELFKVQSPESWEAYKKAQAAQSPATRELVAKAKV